jgi:hypothetical protein
MEKGAMSLTDGAPDLLPVWATVRRAYSSYFHHLVDALRATWLWLILVAPLSAVGTWQQLSLSASAAANLERGAPAEITRSTAMTLLASVSSILFLLAGASIAVAWHRLIILDEGPGVGGRNIATKALWRYIDMALVLVLIAFLPAAAVLLYFLWPVGGRPSAPPEFLLVMLPVSVLYVAGIAIALRLVLLLPARAIGNTRLSFSQTWNQTRGNIWRLFWGLWFTTVPPLLGIQIASLIVVGLPRPSATIDDDLLMQMTALSTIVMICYLLLLPIGIGFLSLAYRHFFESPIELAE